MDLISFPNEFPNSHIEPFGITSVFTPSYNCIAWAFGDNTKWYWPDPQTTYYWPIGVSREINILAFIDLFKTIGYSECENQAFENNFEKIAIFADNTNTPTHAARQLKNGFWTSKLGPNIDVQHTIKSIEDGAYGKAIVFMKREWPVGNNV